MTTPFWCLVVIAALPQLWALVADYCRKQQFGSIDNHDPRAQGAALTGVGARARAAEQNAWEALPVFAVGVLLAHLAGADPAASSTASLLFVAARLLHGSFYLADLATPRSLIFLFGFGCCGWLVLLAARA